MCSEQFQPVVFLVQEQAGDTCVKCLMPYFTLPAQPPCETAAVIIYLSQMRKLRHNLDT